MNDRRLFALFVTAVAVAIVAGAAAIGWAVVRGDRSLLRAARVEQEQISPNADGEQDETLISYELARNATVSIYFEDAAGERYYFRRERPRGAGPYEVYFGGVVDGYRLPGEQLQGEIVSRLLQDGAYTWVVEATDAEGVTERASGSLLVADADPLLPEIRDFSLDRTVFSPNQDGIADRVAVNYFLAKDVAQTRVYLVQPDGGEVPLPEQPLEARPNQRGMHTYSYEGGVDLRAQPPPDGIYPLVVETQDDEGQEVRVERTLTFEYGGLPFASIISPVEGDTLAFNTTTVEICDTLYFTVTVENYGTTPIRTAGPWSGAVYDSDWNYNTVGWATESGVWRLGIGFENALSDYPYRWGLGTPETLTEIDGEYYLMPGERGVVRGGIRVLDAFGVRNPQPVWAGLIHEDIEISVHNNRVDTHDILVAVPTAEERPRCAPREKTRYAP